MSAPSAPRRVEVSLGHLCNNRCAFCMSSAERDRRPAWTPLARAKAELERFYALGCRSAGFLGGEPTVYPGIAELVAYARRLGYRRVALCSNGTRLADRDFCRRLVDAGATRVTLSIHSRDAAVEDGLVTRVPGNLARKVQAVDNLAELAALGRLPDGLSLNPVLFRGNLGDLRGYCDFFAARGVRDVRFNYIWPNGLALRDPAWVPSYREAVPRMAALALWNEAAGTLRLSFGAVPACVLRYAAMSDRLRERLRAKYFDESSLDPANDVTAPGPDGSEPRRFVWQEHKRESLKTRGPLCASCPRERACEGVWRTYAEIHGVAELEPA